MSKGIQNELVAWIVIFALVLLGIAVWFIFGGWVVEWVIKNMDWKVVARCASEHC